MEEIFVNNKVLISRLNKTAMAYMPALELDNEINLLSNVYYSSVMSILHFGQAELNFRKGEKYKALKLSSQVVSYSNAQLKEWNERGISSIEISIATIEKFIKTGILSNKPVSKKEFEDFRLRVAQLLAESTLKKEDILSLMDALDEVIEQATLNGELGVITLMQKKLIELKDVRLSSTRGNSAKAVIPVWKLIGAIIIFGFPVYKSLRCILSGKCCNTVSGLEGAIVFIASVAWKLC